MHQGLQGCNCLHCRFLVISASYRLRQQPRHDSERAKPPPWTRRATLVPLPKQRKINKGRTSAVLIDICPLVNSYIYIYIYISLNIQSVSKDSGCGFLTHSAHAYEWNNLISTFILIFMLIFILLCFYSFIFIFFIFSFFNSFILSSEYEL